MKLVDDWKQGWKWFSVHSMGGAAAVQGTYVALPDDLRHSIPLWGVVLLTVIILAAGIYGRFIDQSK